jgi:hypothetical protein
MTRKGQLFAGAVTPVKPGRPSDYSIETAQAICAEIAGGRSAREICRDPGMPSLRTIFTWLARHDEFRAMYTAAREAQADYLAEELLEIADDARNDWVERRREGGTIVTVLNGEHIQRSRVRIDTRKWLLAKLQPKKYGDVQQTQLTGPGGGPLQVERSLSALGDLSDEELAFLEGIVRRRACDSAGDGVGDGDADADGADHG